MFPVSFLSHWFFNANLINKPDGETFTHKYWLGAGRGTGIGIP
jgi:hypothetical protein